MRFDVNSLTLTIEFADDIGQLIRTFLLARCLNLTSACDKISHDHLTKTAATLGKQ